jgi:hypothetical protein
MQSWVVTLALAGFLTALGVFLDQYYIPLRFKETLRLGLVKAFFWLEDMHIPDSPRRVVMLILRPKQSLGTLYSLFLFIINSFVSIIVSFYVLFQLGLLGVGIILIMLTVFIGWNDLTWGERAVGIGISLVYLSIPIPIFLLARLSFRWVFDSKVAIIRYLSPLITVAIVIGGIVLMFLWILPSIDLDDGVSTAFAISTLIPIFLITMTIPIVFGIKLVADLLKVTALTVFQTASGPQTSPFAYAGALAGVLVLGGQVIVEFLKFLAHE